MASNLLTARKVDTAKPQEREYLLSDGEGLYLRIRPNGSKEWFFKYTLNGKQTKMKIHQVDLLSARKQADAYRDLLKQKLDPRAHIARMAQREAEAELAAQQAEAALANRLSVRQLFERWETIVLSKRKNGSKATNRAFEKDVFPAIGSMAAADVSKADVMSIVDSMLSRGVTRMPSQVFSDIRQMFSFGEDRGHVELNPTHTLKKKNIFPRAKFRERYLSDKEILELMEAIPKSGLSKASASALWIALATGCRIGEISKAKWDDVDLEKNTWLIPAETAKNEEAFKIHLSDFATSHFEVLKSLTDSTYCIPNRENTNHIYTKAITKQVADRQKDDGAKLKGRSSATDSLALSGGKWKPHDLRRTAATMMTQRGILPEIADRCLNHVEENLVRRTYLRHNYESEMKQAWDALGQHLSELAHPSS